MVAIVVDYADASNFTPLCRQYESEWSECLPE